MNAFELLIVILDEYAFSILNKGDFLLAKLYRNTRISSSKFYSLIHKLREYKLLLNVGSKLSYFATHNETSQLKPNLEKTVFYMQERLCRNP